MCAKIDIKYTLLSKSLLNALVFKAFFRIFANVDFKRPFDRS